MILEKINLPDDVKKLNKEEKVILAEEIREEIKNVVSKNGGHLASNLGVVELTIALHSVFDMPKDKIVWDVGHQTYTHKILTGRKEKFKTLRKEDGLAGFPKSEESNYDSFNTGHSSTSISASLGMAKARDIKKENNKVIAVIGDGALTGGMALEALNDAGNSKTDLIVILNDNEMSISKNSGGMARMLTNLRTKKLYEKSNGVVKKILRKIPYLGEKIINLIINIKKGIKQLIIPKMYFEDIGFKYLGPVDGHNIEALENVFKSCKLVKGPILIHIITKKGKGYKFAEKNPNKFHSISSFDLESGEKLEKKKKDYSKVMGEKLVKLAKNDKRIVAITASMEDGTGLNEFASKFPDRFFNVEIAEQHALGFAAGLAKEGMKPVIPIYSSFLQRGYDQIVHDICMQNLPVVICVDRAGIVGSDGETHQGLLDLCFLNSIPNITIMAPKNFLELEKMLEYAIKSNKPIAIRYPRGGEEGENSKDGLEYGSINKISRGKAEVLLEGEDITIISIGKMTEYAYKVACDLKKENINVEVINIRFLKPLDKEKVLKSAIKTKKVITIEDGYLIGGLASSINDILIKQDEKIKILNMGYPDKFIKQSSVKKLQKLYKMDKDSIKENILKMVEKT